MSEITQQFYSYNGEWIEVPVTTTALAADVESLRREVKELRDIVLKGGRAD